MPWVRIAFIVVALLSMSHGNAFPQETISQQLEDDRKLLEGLRKRRLFEVAESYCLNALQRPNLDLATQSSLTVEQLKNATAQTVLSQQPERSKHWANVKGIAAGFYKSNPQHPRTVLVKVQVALSHIAHGRLIRQELDADMVEASQKESALEKLREARRLLSDLGREITDMIPEQQSRKLDEHELSSEQLLALANNVRYQLAVCSLNQAQLFEATDRLNRVDALNRVMENLEEVQSQTDSTQLLWWQSKVSELECARLLGGYDRAKQLIQQLPLKSMPVTIGSLLLEQQLRLAIAMRDSTYSQQILTVAQTQTNRTAPIDLAIVELAMELSLAASIDSEKNQWLQLASKTTRAIELRHGSYWGRRAELALIAGAGGSNGNATTPKEVFNPNPSTPPKMGSDNASAELDLLIRLADQAVRKDRLDDAEKAFAKAVEAAEKEKNANIALQLNVKLSQLFEKQKRHAAAAAQLVESAKQYQQLSLAAPAHLRGCWNFAQTVGSDKRAVERFKQLLSEHLEIWNDKETANQARLYLAQQFEREKNWKLAFENYLAISNTGFSKSIVGLKRTADRWLEDTNSNQTIVRELLAQLNKRTQKLSSNESIGRLSLMSSRLDLMHGSKTPSKSFADQLKKFENIAAISRDCQVIRAVNVCLDDFNAASKLLEQNRDELKLIQLAEDCLASITQSDAATTDNIRQVNALRLSGVDAAIGLLASTNQPTTSWMIRKADLLMVAGKAEQAIQVLEQLEQKFPRNAAVKIQLARALTVAQGKTDPQSVLDRWRRLAGQLKSHSDSWFEAKLNVAELLVQQNELEQARKVLLYIKTIPPGWENSRFKSEFESLLQRCQK